MILRKVASWLDGWAGTPSAAFQLPSLHSTSSGEVLQRESPSVSPHGDCLALNVVNVQKKSIEFTEMWTLTISPGGYHESFLENPTKLDYAKAYEVALGLSEGEGQ